MGACRYAAAVLLIPGVAGHAGQTSPHGLGIAGAWLHVIHLPTLASFWQTSYGETLIGEICLSATAMLLAAGRRRPRHSRAVESSPGPRRLFTFTMLEMEMCQQSAAGIGALVVALLLLVHTVG